MSIVLVPLMVPQGKQSLKMSMANLLEQQAVLILIDLELLAEVYLMARPVVGNF